MLLVLILMAPLLAEVAKLSLKQPFEHTTAQAAETFKTRVVQGAPVTQHLLSHCTTTRGWPHCAVKPRNSGWEQTA